MYTWGDCDLRSRSRILIQVFINLPYRVETGASAANLASCACHVCGNSGDATTRSKDASANARAPECLRGTHCTPPGSESLDFDHIVAFLGVFHLLISLMTRSSTLMCNAEVVCKLVFYLRRSTNIRGSGSFSACRKRSAPSL